MKQKQKNKLKTPQVKVVLWIGKGQYHDGL